MELKASYLLTTPKCNGSTEYRWVWPSVIMFCNTHSVRILVLVFIHIVQIHSECKVRRDLVEPQGVSSSFLSLPFWGSQLLWGWNWCTTIHPTYTTARQLSQTPLTPLTPCVSRRSPSEKASLTLSGRARLPSVLPPRPLSLVQVSVQIYNCLLLQTGSSLAPQAPGS